MPKYDYTNATIDKTDKKRLSELSNCADWR